MLNQLLRFTLVSSALLWLRPRWRGLLALVAFVLLVHVLHGEYLGYVELSGNRDFLVWSYLLKWLALVCGVLAYFLLAVMGVGRARGNMPPEQPAARQEQARPPRQDDGFDFLRDKKELHSRAQMLLEREERRGN
ncbi:MAG: hypothetical protein CME59_02685 [Halioglobus sp.]|nr:hypothetical protein [Halioglobus sp.]|tara:strand:- start:278 stop:682 length:405 start_codon:yes stop_codon:yes gene_type:complete